MNTTSFHGRKAMTVENNTLRVTLLEEGGHIAEVFDKRAGVSPLWIPHWNSVEPSCFGPSQYAAFGQGPDAKLLVGIMGHNLCLDLFGGPSDEEANAGLTVHGEGSVNRYTFSQTARGLCMQVSLPLAQLQFTRTVELCGENVCIRETVENQSALDRSLAWTQHVTLSPPFLDPATTEFRATMGRSVVAEFDPGYAAYLERGTEFLWPMAPLSAGGQADLRRMRASATASGYTAHVADAAHESASFVAFAPQYSLAFGYVWKRSDFPWMGIWEENCSRMSSPWDGCTVTRGMEFGVSPFPESRRAMIDRGRLLDTPTFRWLPAKGKLAVEYWISSQIAQSIPDALNWLGE